MECDGFDPYDPYSDYTEAADICDLCGGFVMFFGGLGNLNHYRCRNCGMEFSRKAQP